MTSRAVNTKSCGPQQLVTDESLATLGIEDLAKRARTENQRIDAVECKLSKHYWNLGQILARIRQQFLHGQWEKFLLQQEIDRTRAAKALAIFRSFPEVETLAELTVEQAYKQRTRKTRKPARRSTVTTESSDPLQASLSQICQQADSWLEITNTADAESANRWLVALADAIRRLQLLQDSCRRRITG